MQVKENKSGIGRADEENCMNHLNEGDYMIVKVNSNSKFTTKGHYILVYRDPNDPEGKVRVWDSYSQNFTNNELRDGYLNGFDNLYDDVLKGTAAYWIVSSEFRDDGYDYTACPEVDEEQFKDPKAKLISKPWVYDASDWLETKTFECNGKEVERPVLNENAPIQYPKKEN